MVMKKRDGLVRSITVQEKEGEIEKRLLERYDRQGAYKGRTAIGFAQVNGGGGGGGGGNVTNGPTPLAAAHTNTEEPSPNQDPVDRSHDIAGRDGDICVRVCVCAYVRVCACVCV